MSTKLRSKDLNPDVPQYYMRRVFFKSMGATDEGLEKPLVAIANTWNEILPGSYNLDSICAAVKRGIREAGGMTTFAHFSLFGQMIAVIRSVWKREFAGISQYVGSGCPRRQDLSVLLPVYQRVTAGDSRGRSGLCYLCCSNIH